MKQLQPLMQAHVLMQITGAVTFCGSHVVQTPPQAFNMRTR